MVLPQGLPRRSRPARFSDSAITWAPRPSWHSLKISRTRSASASSTARRLRTPSFTVRYPKGRLPPVQYPAAAESFCERSVSRATCREYISSIRPLIVLLISPVSVSSSMSAFRHSSLVPMARNSASDWNSSRMLRAKREVDQTMK